MTENLEFISVANYLHLNLKRLKEQYLNAEIDLKILGLDTDIVLGWDHQGNNFGFKLKMLHEYLAEKSKANPETVVVFTDAFDVLFYGSKKEIMVKWNSFHCEAVFSSEFFCHPNPKVAALYPQICSSFNRQRYLCSGAFIGRVGYLYEMMEKYQYQITDDDQEYWTNVFLKEYQSKNGPIQLDLENLIFNNTGGELLDIEVTKNNRFINKTTGTEPNYIHANGSGWVIPVFDNWAVTQKRAGFQHIEALQKIWTIASYCDENKLLLMILLILCLLVLLYVMLVVKNQIFSLTNWMFRRGCRTIRDVSS